MLYRRCWIAIVVKILVVLPLAQSLPHLRRTNVDIIAESGLKMSSKAMSGEKRHNDDKEGVDVSSKSQKLNPHNNNDHCLRDIIHKESHGYDINSPTNVPKRSNYLSWDDYFLSVAYLSAQRSKDPHPVRNSRNGACIVDKMGRIVGIGYDGFPRGCSDDCLPWALSTNRTSTSPTKIIDNGCSDDSNKLPWLETRDPFMTHAAINAILNRCSENVEGGRMYVPNFPSNECAKFIIQSGIKEVVYVKDDDEDSDSSRASRILFEVAGVKMTKIKPTVPYIRINFESSTNADRDVSHSKGKATENDSIDEEEMEKYLGLLQREGGIDPFKFNVRKRSDYLSWDDYFMGVAFLSAQRSKDPNTQVGACIVDSNKCIIGIGYNGFPRGCPDEVLPWSRTGVCELHKKYPYVVHAEVNAILNKCSASVRGASLYVALFPCNECCKVIIQSGVREVVFLHDTYHDTDACKASRIMFKMAGVKLRQYKPDREEIVIDF